MPRPPAPHGTQNRWRTGCRCAECGAAHSAETTGTRRDAAIAALQPHRAMILRRLAAGRSPAEAVEGTPLTPMRLYGIAKWSTEWRTEMDAAQIAGRPHVAHGTAIGYKEGCRCPECREAHHRPGIL